MRLKDEETHRHGRVGLIEELVVAGKKLFEAHCIAQRLAHLLAVDGNHIVVQPILHSVVSKRADSLRNLALVMRELEVDAAAVNVERLA